MGNDQEIKARLKKVLETKNMSVSKITEGEDVKRSTLSAQLSGNSSVSADTIKLFLRKFTDLSAEWLIRGVGNMCCQPSSDINTLFNAQGDNSTNQQIVGASNEALIKENEMLKQLLEEKERMIQVLLKK